MTFSLPGTDVGVYYQDVAIAKAIAQQLGDIGVTVAVETVDWAAYVRELLSDDVAPLFLLGLDSRGDGLQDVKNLDEAPWRCLWRSYNFYGVSQNLDWTPRRNGLVCLYKSIAPPAEGSK
jgi:ABC-type transport system substrate-binding protein